MAAFLIVPELAEMVNKLSLFKKSFKTSERKALCSNAINCLQEMIVQEIAQESKESKGNKLCVQQ